MTPFRSHGRGTLVLKGTFAGVHIERASGTDDPKRLTDLKVMCRTLAGAGRLDVLEQLAAGAVRPLEVWRFFRAGDWAQLPTADHAKAFATHFERWRLTVPGERHRADLALAGRQLAAAGPRGATVAELPAMVARLREQYAARGQARHFNKLRDAASAFLKQTLTRAHPLYLSVRAIAPLVGIRRYQGHPQTPAQAWVIREALGGEAGRIWWGMCCTSMGPKELWVDGFALVDGHVAIGGQKRAARRRLVPGLVTALDLPALGRWGFTTALRRSGLGVTPYDARRTFARWQEEAGILESHQRAYLGHGRTLLDLYRRPDMVTAILDQDQATLLRYVLRELGGGISGGTAPTRNRDDAVSREGIEPSAYGLKVPRSVTPMEPHDGPSTT